MPIPMEPKRFMGQPVDPGPPEDRGPLPRGWWKNVGDEFGFGMYVLRERWAMLDERYGTPLLPEEHEQKVGDRDIPFTPGDTMDELERRIAWYDYEEYNTKYESHFTAGLVGGAGPMTLEPVTLATLPVGGAAFLRGAAAKTWGGFVRGYAWGGAQAGLASVGPEILFQRQETGSLRPMELLGTAVAPIVLSPTFGAIGVGLRRLFKGTRNSAPPADWTENFHIVNRAKQENIPTPPLTPRTAKPAAPTARLKAMFRSYSGGHRAWFRDLAEGREAAKEQARSLGFDPEDPLIQRIVERVGRQSDHRSVTAQEHNWAMLDAFEKWRAGEMMTPEERQILVSNGLLNDVVTTRLETKPLIGPKVTQEGVAFDEATEVGRRISIALDAPTKPENASLIRKVLREGAGAARKTMDSEARAGAGEAAPRTNRVIDDEWDDGELIEALTLARRADRSVDMPAPTRQQAQDEEGEIVGGTPEDADVEAFGRELGAGEATDNIKATTAEAARRAIACGRR